MDYLSYSLSIFISSDGLGEGQGEGANGFVTGGIDTDGGVCIICILF